MPLLISSVKFSIKIQYINMSKVQSSVIFSSWMVMSKKNLEMLKADLFLLDEKNRSLTGRQIKLLKAIEQCGSITNAAKNVGISYKTAWDRINVMNNLSEEPLVRRTAGGSGGGGTSLTQLGKDLLRGFAELQDEHRAFIKRLGTSLHSIDELSKFLRSTTLQTSARNQFRGQISKITKGAINTEVELQLSESSKIIAIVTNESAKQMGLNKGGNAIALIKSSWIILSTDENVSTSARNKLAGSVKKITQGKVNSEVQLNLGNEKSLSCVLTNASVKSLKLKKQQTVYALFKASSVILMTD